MAHPKHQQVRERFAQRCGYCGITEVDSGGELTIDHYRPVSADGDDSDENLVYCCFRCNSYKGDYWSGDASEHRVLHPERDSSSEHYRLDEATGELDPLTGTGSYHLGLLRLNRPPLIAYRMRQRILVATKKKIRLLEQRVASLEQAVEVSGTYAELLRDAPADRQGPGGEQG